MIQDLEAIRTALSDPTRFVGLSFSPDTPVAVEETHISLVFLVGEHVFKTKKAVDFGFLDFTSIEKRLAACEAEVVVNSRLSDDVYRGVVPIRRDANGGLYVDVDGSSPDPVIEHAVHMRRLDHRMRADELLARGDLDERHVDRMADCLSRFHAACASNDRTARFGSVEAIRASVTENFEQSRTTSARTLAAREAREIEAWQLGVLDAERDRFAARQAGGFVRDGHGDLRLEHAYFNDTNESAGGVVFIDAIEFNERFRYADVAADVAFLSMDLAWHGRVDLAERLLARYARESGDFDLYGLVDFYEGYRAYVRGKIAGFVASSETTSPEVRKRALLEARRYFLLALSAQRKPLIGAQVIAVGGVIASGKSTIAKAIARELSAPIIEADRTRKQMLGVRPTTRVSDPSWKGAYDPAFTEEVYREMRRRGEIVLASRRPVILDASFRSRSMRRDAYALALRLGVPFIFVECRASRETCKARLAKREREGGVSDGRLAIFDDFLTKVEPVDELEPHVHVAIDTERPEAETLAEIRSHVATWPGGLNA